MYTWNQLGIVELTNLFLYGGITQPADLSSESRIREADAIKPIFMDAVSFMATGPGRFANGAQIKVVDMFMSGKIGVNSGVRQELNLDEAIALTGVKESDLCGYLASNYADGQDDHALRTYLYETESFRLAKNVTFVIEPDGRRYILDYAILPFDDDFDFKSKSPISQFGNALLEPRIDPWGIGRKVTITFDPGSKDSIPTCSYTQAEYSADVLRYVDTYSPVSGTARLAYEMPSVIDQLWTSHATQFIDAERRVIVYGTQGSDQLSITKINNLPIDSPLRIYYSMNATGIALIGSAGSDTLTGDIRNDLLDGGTGNDTLTGGAGNDTYNTNSGDGTDTLFDSDGQGRIVHNRVTLSGGQSCAPNQWQDAQGNTYTLLDTGASRQDLLIDAGTEHLIVKDYRSAELGIRLTGEVAPAPFIQSANGITVTGDRILFYEQAQLSLAVYAKLV